MRSIILTAVLLAATQSALADVSITPGTSCTAVLPAQSQQLEWRERGLINPSTTRDLFVLCPFTRQSVSANDAQTAQVFWGGAVVVSSLDDASDTRTVSCQVREFVGGTRVWTRNRAADIAPGEQALLTWPSRAVNDETLSTFHVSCRLAAQTAVSSVVSVSSATANNDYLQRLEDGFSRD